MTDDRALERLARLTRERAGGRRLTRREFAAAAGAAGLSAGAAATLWADAARAEPKRGGLFRVGMHDGNTSDSHDPGRYNSSTALQTAHAHRSYLTMITPENALGPDMATAWEASPDARVWTFELERRASFHSGRPFTAEDAVASLNHHRGPDSASAARALLADVTDVRADGPHRLVVELEIGNADLPWLMTDYHLTMCPADGAGGIDWRSGDGAGPYRLTNVEFGVGATFERHDGWHGTGAWFDALEFVVLNDPNARQSELLTGRLDAVSQIDLKTKALLEAMPAITVENVPSAAAVTLPMHCDTPPFDALDVRLALKHAVDRAEIVEKVFFDAAIVGDDNHVAPSMPYHAPRPPRLYDPDRARFHLKKAGAEGLTVSLSAADGVQAGAVDLCTLYAAQAARAGITINVVREPNDSYWSDVWLKKPFCCAVWGPRPTPDVLFSLGYRAGAEWNESRWENPRFNALLLAAKGELDQPRRAEMYAEMQTLLADDGGTVIPLFKNFAYARRATVARPAQVAASWELDGARATSRWWFA
ncbi:MAG: ABC transporter substrate-binding protein [Pseudomonadota bacterium]